ncbi:MAG TPA: hypothetical protein VFO10_29280 [Oligoflexus sp.]|uniref:hypothetical protein n=1 Tax=Oligoflexus sp. TaxID=1971216 RepID=UPI002D806160|nr:hypothetical protein [Oligoflexus sp.]HET9241395.1 hypothetical protein [Oligoflexus sp.]
MADGRSQRKARVIPFVGKLDHDRAKNLDELIAKAQLLKVPGFENIVWAQPTWNINDGRLTKLTGKNVQSLSLNFQFPPKLGGQAIPGEWADLAKALLILRFHRKHQSAPNQRNFITAVACVAFEALKQNRGVAQLVPEHLDHASRQISALYSEGVAYNLHKAIGELTAHCDANKLCKVHLDYKYSGMKRPENTGGLDHKRLDDPEVLQTRGDKLIDPAVFRVIGQLYQNVPSDHKYRIYVLILSLLACLGRRFSEISLLPVQEIGQDYDGRSYIEYFPRKVSKGDTFTPRRRLYLPSETIEIVRGVFVELNELCASARQTAAFILETRGPDLRFLNKVPDNQVLLGEELEALGVPSRGLAKDGWFRANGFAIEIFNQQGKQRYGTTKAGIVAYCMKDLPPNVLAPIHVDQHGKEYFLKDLLIVKYGRFTLTGADKPWVSTQCTHSMVSTFLRYFDDLTREYASSTIDADFNSHDFRHTLNTLLDEGGLSELLQTEWFGRKNPRDTKVYQHTSREKRALTLREDIKKGLIGGQLVEQINHVPVGFQEAYLKARVNGVHDVGAGLCVHNFAQTPCERHLQCSADCNDYVWAKKDQGRVEELKRQYAMTAIARETAEALSKQKKSKKSSDWLAHNEKKIKVLSQQLKENNVPDFDPHKLLEDLKSE